MCCGDPLSVEKRSQWKRNRGADGLGVALRDDTAVIQYRDMLTPANNKAHVVFDEQNRDVEFIPHKTDGLHQFGSLIAVSYTHLDVYKRQPPKQPPGLL